MPDFTHFDSNGNAIMVDVTSKDITERTAIAVGTIMVNRDVFNAIVNKTAKKGDVLQTARIAGIMGAKRTSDLIPMCHPLMLTSLRIDFELDDRVADELSDKRLFIKCKCTAKLSGKTGVEMEALTGVSVALLTIYDMCKAMDRAMEIKDIHLLEKSGGKSGHFVNYEKID